MGDFWDFGGAIGGLIIIYLVVVVAMIGLQILVFFLIIKHAVLSALRQHFPNPAGQMPMGSVGSPPAQGGPPHHGQPPYGSQQPPAGWNQN